MALSHSAFVTAIAISGANVMAEEMKKIDKEYTDMNKNKKLNVEEVERVSGGQAYDDHDTGETVKPPACPTCGSSSAQYVKPTGKTREGSFLGIVDDIQYHCENCGTTFWDWGD